MSTFKPITPLYEAMQWTGSNYAALSDVIDPSGDRLSQNEDGTLTYQWAMPVLVAPNAWIVSGVYYGVFPGWESVGLTGIMPDPDFHAQFETV